MFRQFLLLLIGLCVAVSCQNDCADNAPPPLGFFLHWQNAKGEDAYTSKLLHKDSLVAFYKYNHKIEKFKLNVDSLKEDSTFHFINLMPMVRKTYQIDIDTLFIGCENSDIDTIFMNLVKIPNECFSTLYEFKKLTYNGEDIEEDTDGFYKITKNKK